MPVPKRTADHLAERLYLDWGSGTLYWNGHPRRLDDYEVGLLVLSVDHSGKTFIVDAVWGPSSTVSPETVYPRLRRLSAITPIAGHLRHPRAIWTWLPSPPNDDAPSDGGPVAGQEDHPSREKSPNGAVSLRPMGRPRCICAFRAPLGDVA
jgi:hypothetical protein